MMSLLLNAKSKIGYKYPEINLKLVQDSPEQALNKYSIVDWYNVNDISYDAQTSKKEFRF